MTPREYSLHVDLVGKVVKAELRSYWTAQPDPEVDALEVASWVEELQDWSIDEIRAGFSAWVRDNPSKRPNRGHISQLLKRARGKAWVEQKSRHAQPEPPARAISPEDMERRRAGAEAIMAGFRRQRGTA